MAGGGEKPKALTANQKRFVEEYVIDNNAVAAYFRAFGRSRAGRRRSYFSAAELASRLLKKVEVRAEIAAARRERSRRCRVSADRVLRELASVGFSDATEAFDDDPHTGLPRPRPLREIPIATRRAIQSVKVKKRRFRAGDDEVEEVEEVEFKFASKLDALDKLCRHLGITKDGAGLDALLASIAAARGVPADGAGDGPPAAEG